MGRLTLLIFGCVFLLAMPVLGQGTNIPLYNDAYHMVDRSEIKAGKLYHDVFTGFKPYQRKQVVDFTLRVDTLPLYFKGMDRENHYYIFKDNSEWTKKGQILSKKPIFKHLYKYKSDFFFLNDVKDFNLKINPVIYVDFMKELDNPLFLFVNTRGIEVRGNLLDKISFYTYITDNQARFPSYAHSDVMERLAVPEEGRFQYFRIKDGQLAKAGVDFFSARGYVSIQPIKYINIQFGHDKNFIGNGYRSLVLSDNSNSYLFLKLSTRVWRFQYTNLFTELVGQFDNLADGLREKKYAAIHHLSFDAARWLNIGVFESVVMHRENGGFDLNYLNPIIFYRFVDHAIGSPDNVLLGMDMKVLIAKRFSLYGQFIIDEFSFDALTSLNGDWRQKFGIQAGVKYIDVAGVTNLDAQLEFNSVRPYTYSHKNVNINYSHFNQPLAHPLGANFREFIGIVRYKPIFPIQLQWKTMYYQFGDDLAGANYGGDILLDYNTRVQDTGNSVAQGNRVNVLQSDLTASYMWKHNIFVDAFYSARWHDNAVSGNQFTQYFGIGVRMNTGRRSHFY